MPELRTDYFSYLADISPSWQGSFVDDGLYEGFPLDGVAQKVADGLTNYTSPGQFNHEKWQVQFDSIKHFDILLAYHYYRTEQRPVDQAAIFVDILARHDYVGGAIDFEGFGNQITEGEIWDLVAYVKHFKANSDKKLLIYTNGWIYDFVAQILKWRVGAAAGQEWLDDQTWWIAGGMIYNQKLYALPTNEYDPFPQIPWTLLQFSADGNEMADELDFSDHEREAIDYNRVRLSPQQLYEFFDVALTDSPDDAQPSPTASLEDRVLALDAQLRNHELRIKRLERQLLSSGGIADITPPNSTTTRTSQPNTVTATVKVAQARYHYQEGDKLRLSTQRDPRIREVRGTTLGVTPTAQRWQRREGGTDRFHFVPALGAWLKAGDLDL